MLPEVWAAIDEGRNADAWALLGADPALLASRGGQLALGYALAHDGLFDRAREVYIRLRADHAGDPWEHIAVHQLGMVERLAGEYRAALRLFTEERALIGALPEGERAFKRAVNGYELGVCHLALGETWEAKVALDAALAGAREAGDPMTLGCVHRALGDFATQTGDRETARAEYSLAQAAFLEAGADQAASDVQARANSL